MKPTFFAEPADFRASAPKCSARPAVLICESNSLRKAPLPQHQPRTTGLNSGPSSAARRSA